MNAIDRTCIDTIRFLAVDAVEKARSGHPGMPMGAAPMAYVLWDRILRHNPGDPLWFDVAYSRDGGETWDVFATGLTDTHVMVSSSQIAGSEHALFRVYATDGVRTAEATSGPLVIERKPPMVFITAPEQGQVLPPGVPVGFGGMALDWEDNTPGTLALHWSSNRDGWLGDGGEVMVPGLSPGWHEVTLSAADSDGMVGTARVNVFVGFQLYLPILLRRG